MRSMGFGIYRQLNQAVVGGLKPREAAACGRGRGPARGEWRVAARSGSRGSSGARRSESWGCRQLALPFSGLREWGGHQNLVSGLRSDRGSRFFYNLLKELKGGSADS